MPNEPPGSGRFLFTLPPHVTQERPALKAQGAQAAAGGAALGSPAPQPPHSQPGPTLDGRAEGAYKPTANGEDAFFQSTAKFSIKCFVLQ